MISTISLLLLSHFFSRVSTFTLFFQHVNELLFYIYYISNIDSIYIYSM